MLVETESNRSA